jgi:hypothetical protein
VTGTPAQTADHIRFAIAHAAVGAWNNEWPVGTLVEYWPGERLPGRPGRRGYTRSDAQVLGGHTAVIWITGQPGAIALDHVRPINHGDSEGGAR